MIIYIINHIVYVLFKVLSNYLNSDEPKEIIINIISQMTEMPSEETCLHGKYKLINTNIHLCTYVRMYVY